MRGFWCCCFFLFLITDSLAQNSVFVTGKEKGNGFLTSRAGELFLICPLHVMNELDSEIQIVNRDRVGSIGTFETGFDSDLCIIRLTKGGIQNTEVLTLSKNYKQAISNAYDGFVEYVTEIGQVKLFHVNISEKNSNFFKIQLKNSDEQFMKGMSGSAFYTSHNGSKVLSGMLLELGSDLKEGYVIQLDNILNVTSSFFDISLAKHSNVGVLIVEEDGNVSSFTNDYMIALKTKTPLNSFSNLSNEKAIPKILNVFGGNLSGLPQSLSKKYQKLTLGKVSVSTEKNSYNMFVSRLTLEILIIDTSDFSVINSHQFTSKGVDYNEKNSVSKAKLSLKTNL